MARPFSRSVRALLATFMSAVSRTRPSHGIISVGAVYRATSALLSFAVRDLDTSTARSRVAKRLVSSTNGASCPGDHSAYSNGTPYLPTRIGCIQFALPIQVLSAARCQSVSAVSGMGSQARETPCGLEISARVVTSKVRQPGSARRRRQGSAARTAAPSSSRRFMAREANGGRPRSQAHRIFHTPSLRPYTVHMQHRVYGAAAGALGILTILHSREGPRRDLGRAGPDAGRLFARAAFPDAGSGSPAHHRGAAARAGGWDHA